MTRRSRACSRTQTPSFSPPCASASQTPPTRSSRGHSRPRSPRPSGSCWSSASPAWPPRPSSRAVPPPTSSPASPSMAEPGRELALGDIPRPPLFRLVDGEGRDVLQETEVGGERARVAALFSDRELAGEFSAGAAGHGMVALAGADPRELADWGAVRDFALGGADYVLVLSGEGAGLFHAEDVAGEAAGREGEVPLPLYVISDDGGEVLVVALFGSPEGARSFRERAAHLGLPDRLGTIDDPEGLVRHALVARDAGAEYAVIDPGSGLTDAVPIEELIRP